MVCPMENSKLYGVYGPVICSPSSGRAAELLGWISYSILQFFTLRMLLSGTGSAVKQRGQKFLSSGM